ncbi:MAG: lipoyl(octanoyl) transferase LipB [Bacteroidota bacterium]|nr:lipoyl(octanoyl) transferase LipB [Bacteroidota bacterium]
MNKVINRKVKILNLGLVPYADAWQKQEKIFKEIIDLKIKNRDESIDKFETPNYIITCEHPHVYTLGKSGDKSHLLINNEELKEREAVFFETNRGGDITYHGPGQLVVYPILDLENFFTDIHKYLRLLEEAVIITLRYYGIESGRIEGLTGVWLGTATNNPRKICAFGVRSSRWVTMHGLALNVNVNLEYFNNIVPCGISDKAVTSMHIETYQHVIFEEVRNKLIQNLTNLFQMEITE